MHGLSVQVCGVGPRVQATHGLYYIPRMQRPLGGQASQRALPIICHANKPPVHECACHFISFQKWCHHHSEPAVFIMEPLLHSIVQLGGNAQSQLHDRNNRYFRGIDCVVAHQVRLSNFLAVETAAKEM
eukprot:1144471-Pelagomonas_calceolata.AAC.4